MSAPATTVTERTFEQNLDKLAEVAVQVGLGLKAGQELVMTASLDSVPLARRITEHAYRAGASLVTTLYVDDEATLARYRFAPDASFDKAAGWLYDGMGTAFKSGAARLAIAGANPSLLSNEDPDKVGRANRAVSAAYRPALELITRHEINWTIVASATPAWAAAMFPNDAPDVALAKLWEAIFKTTRITLDDPVSAWKTHDAELHKRAAQSECEALCGAALSRAGHGFPARAVGRSSVAGRWHDGGQWELLHPQHAHRRSVHDAA